MQIGSDPLISEFIKTFEIQRPVQRSFAPKLDLACILSSLCKDPYEPLHKASLLNLTEKTAFLLTMATAKWVSEIHALAMDTEHLRFDKTDGSVSLRTQMGFFAKINFLLKVLWQFFSQIWLKPWLEKMITSYLVRLELWNVTRTRPRLLERTGLDCSFLSREITILQKDWLHGGLHLWSRRHMTKSFDNFFPKFG